MVVVPGSGGGDKGGAGGKMSSHRHLAGYRGHRGDLALESLLLGLGQNQTKIMLGSVYRGATISQAFYTPP